MYGDLQFTNGSYKFKGSGKVFKIKAHPAISEHDFIVGFAGQAAEMLSVKYFFESPETMKPPKVRDLYGLILTETGNVYRFDNYTKWIEIREPFAAIGSGRDFALGALSSGKTPKEAVKLASQHDIYTGLGITGCRIV